MQTAQLKGMIYPQWGKNQICDIGSGRDILPVLCPSYEGSLKSTKLLILPFRIDRNVYKISCL